MDMGIDDLLTGEGFDTSYSRRRARELLEQRGLTNPLKKRIHVDKVQQVHRILVEQLYRVCSNAECVGLAERQCDGRELVTVSSRSCRVCCGSNYEREIGKLCWGLEEHNKHHVLLIGGQRGQNRKIQIALEGKGVKCRTVDGVKDLQSRQLIKANVNWADVAVIRGGTCLPHTLSGSYKATAKGCTDVISLAHPGTIRMGRDVITDLSRMRKQ